ncbi:MAG: serine protease [Planctomycetota bacterium]
MRHAAHLASVVAAGLWLAVAAPAAAQWWPWWPQPRGPAPFEPELFADYLASGQAPHPAVVRIVAAERGATSLGSGVLVDVDATRGLIVTNHHVVRDTRSAVLVQFPDGFQSAGTVLREDPTWDLAVIVVWRPPASPVILADAPPAIGAPLTIAGWGRGTFRAQSGPCTQYLSPGTGQPRELVELVASARQGDSGGPILDASGRLAGVLFGENDGRTVGSAVTRVRAILASVGSAGASPIPAPFGPPLPGPVSPLAVANPAGSPPAPAAAGPAWAEADPGPLPESVAVASAATDETAAPPTVAADGVPVETVSPRLPDVGALVDKLRTPEGREAAVQAAGGIALSLLGLRAVFRRRRRP